MPKSFTGVHLSPGQASYVIDHMLSERRISAGEVNRYVNDMRNEIHELEQRLQMLRQASGGVVPRAARPATAPRAAAAPKAGRKRRRAKITPEQLASRQLQGRYLGLIRQIPAGKRPPYQKIAREKGREAAIRALQVALKK